MQKPLYFDELQVGDTWTTPARTITESDVTQFASLTGDFDPLHVDHHFAAQTPFRKPIAHGLLGLAFVAGLGYRCPWVKTEAFTEIREWKFLKPIFFGDTMHAVAEIVELTAKNKRRGIVLWSRKLVNHDDEVVQQGLLETVVSFSPRHPKPQTDQ